MVRYFANGVMAAVLVMLPGVSAAQTEPYITYGAQSDLTLDIGGGPIYGFSPSGGKANQINFIPWGALDWRDRVYADDLDGVGYNVVKTDTLRAGLQVRPRYAAGTSSEGLELPGLGADLTAYAFQRIGHNFVVGGRVMHDVSNGTKGTSAWLSLGHQDLTPVGLLQSIVYTSLGDRRTNQAYYGVDARQAAQTGMPIYTLGGGAQNVGIAFLMMTPVSKHYAVGTFANAERALGDVADSPLMKDDRTTYRGGFIVIRRFGGTLR